MRRPATEQRLDARRFRRHATGLSAAFALAGLCSLVFFSLASHVLPDLQYKRITLLWSVVILTVALVYRPIEQLIARSIAGDRARRGPTWMHLRAALVLEAGLALAFLLVSLAARNWIQTELFDGSSALFWIMVGAVLSFACGFALRGWLAGCGRFGLYGLLVLAESSSRVLFPAAVLVGLAAGEAVVAAGVLAAPLVGVVVVLVGLAGRRWRVTGGWGQTGGSELWRKGAFAQGAFAVLLAEQLLLTAGVLAAQAQSPDGPIAGFVFNAMLVSRAAVVLFQAVQAALLPHLAALTGDPSSESRAALSRMTRETGGVCAALGLALATVMLVAGPRLMTLVFGPGYAYGRIGLMLVAVGVGFHLFASSYTQVALAHARVGLVAIGWLVAAGVFVGWLALPLGVDPVVKAEVGYVGATALLAGLMLAALQSQRKNR